jgi:hypothetical protein
LCTSGLAFSIFAISSGPPSVRVLTSNNITQAERILSDTNFVPIMC